MFSRFFVYQLPHESAVDSAAGFDEMEESPMANRDSHSSAETSQMREKLSRMPSQKMLMNSEVTYTSDEDDSDE